MLLWSAPVRSLTAPSDLSAQKVAAPAPPALAALRLLHLFPAPLRAPVLVATAGREQALRALSTGTVSAAILPVLAAQSLRGMQIALETDASPGRAFSVSRSISATQKLKLLAAFRDLGSSAQGRRVLSCLDVSHLRPATSDVYEGSEQLLKGTWGY